MARSSTRTWLAALSIAAACAAGALGWIPGPDVPFAMSRFDAGYFPGDGLVYFLGGRLGDSGTDGSVWRFDPATGISLDTGTDMAVPVSNYTMNLVHDANGWGFYVFCGRDAAGAPVRTVQVYYPGTDTAVALPPADDFPEPLGCLGALNVVYRDRVYVAGGLYTPGPTYNHAETYVFDPMAASGSRWTHLESADLAVARSYIMGTLFDGKIWAIGGNWYDGTNLINVATVEVLDPKAASPTWNDAGVPDLPEGCSEGRAWAIDHRWGYRSSTWSNVADRILINCGGWSAESERTYLFSGATGAWTLSDPLLVPRRDQAAELLFPRSGNPGFWLWGGRSGSDTTLLNTSEQLPLIASNCDVLLVEDDDVPAGYDGGYPYYWSTLDWMGFRFDPWHRGEGGVPPPTTLNAHEVVVWYTGADYTDVVNSADQAALITYLNGGGNALLSSLDQLYAHGATPLTTTYFGVGSYVSDRQYDVTHGYDGDPMSSHLGIYNLVEPTDFDDYWPSSYLYSDEVHAGTGAVDELLWETVHTPSTVRKQGPTYRTEFLAWPFEWIDTISERVEMMGNSLHWLCPIHRDGFESGNWQEWYAHTP